MQYTGFCNQAAKTLALTFSMHAVQVKKVMSVNWKGSKGAQRLQHALQVKGVPLISFDVGGIGEMLEYAEHGDVIVMESTAKALSQKLQGEGSCRFRWCNLQTEHPHAIVEQPLRPLTPQ